MESVSYSAEFLQQIPKTDLHVHLDGSLRIATVIELAEKDGLELPYVEFLACLERANVVGLLYLPAGSCLFHEPCPSSMRTNF